MQIINTYKCNLHCAHCLFFCSHNREGYLDNYTLSRFLEKSIAQRDDFVNYCGGETFLHPEWDKQIKMLVNARFLEIRIVTNGLKLYSKKKDISNTMEKLIDIICLNEHVRFSLMISDDRFHRAELLKRNIKLEDIIRSVEYATQFFGDNFVLEKDRREMLLNKFAPLGRALKNEVYDHDGGCILDTNINDQVIPEITLDPYGKIYTCCNAKGYIGTVITPDDVIEERLSKIKPQKNCLRCIYKGLDKIKEKEDIYHV